MRMLNTKLINERITNNSLNYRKFNRRKLPRAKAYYQQQFNIHRHACYQSWVSVRCCFHKDVHPSLRINLLTGAFRCFACGAHGGDIIAFHQKRYGLSFRQTINHFNAWG